MVAKSNLAHARNSTGKPAERLRGVRGEAVAQGPLELDRLIHERMRLAIVSALAVNPSLSFNELKQLLDTTVELQGRLEQQLGAITQLE